jgi:hypothetical protein
MKSAPRLFAISTLIFVFGATRLATTAGACTNCDFNNCVWSCANDCTALCWEPVGGGSCGPDCDLATLPGYECPPEIPGVTEYRCLCEPNS